MAPLYQHTNRQRVTLPVTLMSGNYIIKQNSGTTALTTQVNNTLRIQAGELTPVNRSYTNDGLYMNNAYIKYNQTIQSGAKTLKMIMKFNALNGNGLGLILSSDTKAISVYARPNNFRAIGWTLTAPNGAPTNYAGIGGPVGWYDSASTIDTVNYYGVMIVDDGASLSFSKSIDNGSNWTNFATSTYAQSGLTSSPINFGLFTMPSQSGSMLDCTVHSITIT